MSIKQTITLSELTHLILPAIITLFLVLVGSINFQIEGLFVVMPFFSAICVFYWQIYQPRTMHKLFVFFLGLFQDILYGTTLGTSSILLLLLWAIVAAQREYIHQQRFMVCWLIFCVLIGLYALIGWLLNNIVSGQFILDEALIYQYIISILCYPAFHKLFLISSDNKNKVKI